MGYCKFYKQKRQIYLNGIWIDTGETRKGDFYENDSIDCGYIPPPMYRWVVVPGAYECSGTTKMTQEKKQVSNDSGSTWEDVVPLETRAGSVIETQSTDCGWEPPYKCKLEWINGSIETIPCDSSSHYKAPDTRYYRSNIVSAKVGSCVTHLSDCCAFCNYWILSSVTLSDSVTYIGESAFDGCTSLTGITIPNSVTNIRNDAFNGCTSLTSIDIPDSVLYIDRWAFAGCSSASACTIGSGLTGIAEGVFTGCGFKTVSMPNTITYIGINAFRNCSGLTSIDIPDSVTNIMESAFTNCYSLSSVTIGSGITNIDNYAFYYCSSLQSIVIPDSVTRIGICTFYDCNSLTSVTIPDSVTTIGSSAFYNCSALTSVTLLSTTPPSYGLYPFYGTNDTFIYYVPAESVDVYKEAWPDYASRIQAIPT